MKSFKNFIIKRQKILIFISLICILSFLSVVYATYGSLLKVHGYVTFTSTTEETLRITNISLIKTTNVASSSDPTYEGTESNYNINFQKTKGNVYEANYQVEITNGTKISQTYTGYDFTPTVSAQNFLTSADFNVQITGIKEGTVIAPNEKKIINVRFVIKAGGLQIGTLRFNTTAKVIFNFGERRNGSILANLQTDEIFLEDDEIKEIKISTMNTYSSQKLVTFISSNENYCFVDDEGNELTEYTLSPNSMETTTLKVKKIEDAITGVFETTNILLDYDENRIDLGTVNIRKYPSKENIEVDNQKIEIQNLRLDIRDTVGSIEATWQRKDSGGTSLVKYVVMLYNGNNQLLETKEVNGATTNYTFHNLEEGSYYVKVYGEDEAGNSGLEDVSSSTISNPYCPRTENKNFKWTFTVNTRFSNLESLSISTINLNETLSVTLIPYDGYTYPETVTVRINNIVTNNYTYNNETGALDIPNINGNVTIEANAAQSCLVEGTKITLYDGTKKNVEDIKYNDLLLVWNYETGKFSYEYPTWIEKTKKTNHYTLVKLSDGTELKVVGKHGVYSFDLNRFVSVNTEELVVGSTIAKYEDGWKKVKVTEIKQVKETINYYHVISNRYYNIIANDLLTTDGTVVLSNLYNYDDNITWTNKEQIYTEENLFTEEELAIVPVHLFDSLRVREGKILVNAGYLTKEIFIYYLLENPLNSKLTLKPYQENNINKWMVTTSDTINKSELNNLVLEGTKYIVPSPLIEDNFKYWYNHADNKYYNVGDEIVIKNSIYLEAIYN